ncbi:von Willebrand factor type A domain protein [Symmachiella dynata]|uniref:von Willebrand factor type A domain protein n=1 Tax=Symmachiella dynata TaxID=2527995 RepID=A0A517ZPS1_9PLAN|nr:VWA domain-containing protein [Symmachiella dynata]QDU44482.1 von Willebrand factor type A domain protein [Symmachiella dynata]
MSPLQKTMEWLLEIPPAGAGQGTSWRYRSDFPWPDWVLLLFAVAAVAVVILVYRRDATGASRWMRGLLVAMRLGAIFLLLFMLSSAFLSVDRTGLPYAVVILDNSGSMTAADPYQDDDLRSTARTLLDAADYEEVTPLNVGKAILLRDEGAFLKRLLQRHKLRIYKLAGAATKVAECITPEDVDEVLPQLRDLEAEGDRTQLGQGLRSVLNDLRGAPPTAIILLSDGITTEGEKLSAAATFARRKGVPIFALGLGDAQPVRDLEITDVQVDDVAFVNDPITFLYTLSARGYAGKTVSVTLRDESTGDALTTERIKLDADERTQKLELTYTPPEVGEFQYVVDVQLLPKEANTENNRQVRGVSVRKEKIRVLLADSLPRYEFRFLKTLLEREKTVELKTVLQDADAEYADEDRTALQNFPVNEEDLFSYDVILFGDMDLAFLTERTQQELQEFVNKKSGGLLMIAGTQHNPIGYRGTPLEDLLPVQVSDAVRKDNPSLIGDGFRPVVTLDGRKGTSIFRLTDNERDDEQVWRDLPPFMWAFESVRLKRGAVAFAVHPQTDSGNEEIPIIAMHRFGGGKVIFHATDETWRWRYRVGDLYFGRYWVQVIRYLSRSKLLGRDRGAELTVDRKEYMRGTPVQFRVNFLDDRLISASETAVTVVVQQHGGPRRQVDLKRLPQAPTIFEGTFANPVEGTYHAFIASPTFENAPPSVDFRVTSPMGEMRTVKMDVPELTQAAKITGGAYHTLLETDDVLAAVPRGNPVPLETEAPKQLWNFWLTFALFVGLLCGEWILRKRLRLV